MNTLQDDYLLALRQESARSLAHYQFGSQQPTPTQSIEFHLLHRILTTADGQDAHLALDGHSTDPAFLARLLDTVVLAKYHQNWIDSQQLPTGPVRPGDMLFHKDNLLCCAEVYPGGNWTVCEAFRKNAQSYKSPIKKAIVLLRKEKYDYKPRKTAGQLISYRNHFRQVLNEPKLDVLSQFAHKTLIIGNDDLLVGQPAYPVRYWSRTGTVRAHGLPIDTMVEACGTIDTALNYIFTGTTYFDEVIVVGSERYKKSGLLDNLRNEKNLGNFGKLILIGDQTPELGSQSLKSWRWLPSELKQLQNKAEAVFQFDKLVEPVLQTLVTTLRRQLDRLHQEAGVDASELLVFLRFYYRLFLPAGPRREAILRDFHNRLELYLQSDELHDKFAVAGHYNPEDVATWLASIRESLMSIRDYFLAANPKYDRYLANEGAIAPRLEAVVLASARYANDVVLRDRGHLLTYSGQSHANVTAIQNWSRSTLNDTPGRIYYVFGWSGPDTLLQLQRLSGRVVFNLLEGVETDEFTRDWDRVMLNLERWQQHTDRTYWFTARPPVSVPRPKAPVTPQNQLIVLADATEFDPMEPEQLYAVSEQQAPKYRLEFTDGTADEFYGYKSLWLLRNGQKQAVTVGELFTDARVQFYQNASSDTFNQIIQQRAGAEKNHQIDTHSRCWRDYCQCLLTYYHHDLDHLYAQLQRNGMTSRQNSLRGYLQPETAIRFPQKRTMNALFKLGTAIGLTSYPFITDYKGVMASRKWDRNLRHSTGRQLSDELMQFGQTGNKGELLSQLSDNLVYSLIQSIQEKTVASITLSTH